MDSLVKVNSRSRDFETDSVAASFVSTQKSAGRASTRGDLIETYITIPPDGGWGWVVVVASFFCNFVVDGSVYTFGIFLDPIGKSFGVHPTTVATANSLLTGFCFLFGPLTCALVNRYGFRFIGIIGGLLSSIAFFASSLMTSVTPFLIVLGITGGLGFSMIYVPSVVVIGFYFDRWRALATSVAVTGSAFGIIAFPLVIDNVLSSLSWQGQFNILGGCFIIVALLAILYRPLKPVRVYTDDSRRVYECSIFSDDTDSSETLENQGCCKKWLRKLHKSKNTAYPTTAEVFKDPTTIFSLQSVSSASSTFIGVTTGSMGTIGKSTSHMPEELDKLSTVYEVESVELGKCKQCCHRCKTRCNSWFTCFHIWCHKYPNRPMYRDDIFYHASMATVPLYSTTVLASRSPGPSRVAGLSMAASTATNRFHTLEYHMSVSRVVTQKDLEEHMQFCKCCPEAVKRTLATMLDLTLLKSPSFLLLAISGLLTTLGMYSPFIYIEEKAEEEHVQESTRNYLLPVLGIANAIGRLGSGLIASFPQTKPLPVSIISIGICGIITFIVFFLKDASGLFLFVIIFGLTIACLPSLRAPIVVDMLGLEKLTSAFGILLLFQGVASFAGVPLSGAIVQATNSYSACFLFSGSCLILSAVVMVPIKKLSAWEKNRARKT